MLKNKSASLLRGYKEEGFSLVEVLVSAAIILMILTFAAVSSGTIFETQSSNEARNRAVGVAQDRISRAQLVDFIDLGFPVEHRDLNQADGGYNGATSYNDESLVFIPSGSPALGMMPYEETRVGQYDLRVNTYVTTVKSNSFDSTVGSFSSPEDLSPKRITVVVQWDEKEGTQTVVRSVVRSPSPSECAPRHALTDPNDVNAPAGCLG